MTKDRPAPKKVQFCGVCHQPMTWFGDHWVCVNIKVHDHARGGT